MRKKLIRYIKRKFGPTYGSPGLKELRDEIEALLSKAMGQMALAEADLLELFVEIVEGVTDGGGTAETALGGRRLLGQIAHAEDV